MKILAVDDEEDTLLLLKDLLTEAGHRVVTASEGLEAMAAAQMEPFDAVLLDLMMPGTDGYQVARFLSDHWNTSSIPVIVITCRRDEESKSFAKIFGCVRYLEKPFEPAQLLEALRDIDSGHREEVLTSS
jgi:DNA-binding response OmpR family regulator